MYLDADLSHNPVGSVVFVVLAVDVEEGGQFGVQLACRNHLVRIECFAHGYGLQVFDVIFEVALIFLGMEDSSAEVLDLDHACRIMIMMSSLFVERIVLT